MKTPVPTWSPTEEPVGETTVLIVSERPEFLHLAHRQLSDRAHVVGCTGPVQSPCPLETHGRCPLAERASLALVDSPDSAIFRCHWKAVASGTYAEQLQQIHPLCTVMLCGARAGSSGPTGDVVNQESALSTLAVNREVLQIRDRIA